jgi:uncharacterized membrane protein
MNSDRWYLAPAIGASVAFLLALLFLIVGLWKTILLIIVVVIGAILGFVWDYQGWNMKIKRWIIE